MPNQNSSHDYDLLDRLVEEFNDRFRRGERPAVQEYCDRYPALADDLRELLPAVAQVEHAKEVASDNLDCPVPSIVLNCHFGAIPSAPSCDQQLLSRSRIRWPAESGRTA